MRDGNDMYGVTVICSPVLKVSAAGVTARSAWVGVKNGERKADQKELHNSKYLGERITEI